MKIRFKNTVLFALLFPTLVFSQTAPPLGTAADFVLFTSVGATTNAAPFSKVTGNFGTNSGSVSGFGNVNGKMYTADAISNQCAIDLGVAYADLSSQVPGDTLGLVLGSGQLLSPNVYLVPDAVSLIDTLVLDGCGNPNACFVFQIDGAIKTTSYATIVLINGAKACNVFWKAYGAVTMETYTSFKGTVIAEGAIDLRVGVNLDGRALSTVGAVTVSGVTIGNSCLPPTSGPLAPDIGTVNCFALLTSDGTVTNTGSTSVVGDIGTNSAIVSGYDPLGVVGFIHPIPDASTAQASTDLNTLYTYLNSLPTDIELLYPVLFGSSHVLTPNVYVMNAATMLTDTIFLDAQGVAGAVFVIRINGALTTNANPQVVLVRGAEAKNVFWQVEGAVTISGSGNFNGIIVANNASIILNAGVVCNGRALVTFGDITTADVNITGTISTSTAASSTPTLCINTALTAVTHATTGATGIGTATGLPAGITAAWSANTITISGTPTVSGTFNYNIPSLGGCGSVNSTGTITVNPVNATPANSVSAPSSTPNLCRGSEIFIIHSTTGATGIGSATGLPVGAMVEWSADTIILRGTSTSLGTFNYSIPLTGGCGNVNATGAITVDANSVIAEPSPILCINTAFSYIAATTTGATGIAPSNGLPPGVSASWSANKITLSGTPTVSGTFNYSIPLTGGCSCLILTGTISVSLITAPDASLITASSATCHGVQTTLNGNVTAIGAWTLTLSDSQTTTGNGNGAWSIVVVPTATTIYTISSIIDASASPCLGTVSGSTTLILPLKGTITSYDNESTTCVVNQVGWIDYYHSSGRLIASINSEGQDLGAVTVTSFVDTTVQSVPDCSNPSSSYATAIMQRHWVMTPAIQPTLPVQVRLPFADTEYDNLVSVANSNTSISDDIATINDIKLTKYSGPLNVNSSAIDNCVSTGGSGGGTLHLQSLNGLTTSYSNVTSSKFIDFTISEFSEFWLHASVNNSPLPIELLDFTVLAHEDHIQLNWVTATEINNDYFNVERSENGLSFESIGEVAGSGNSNKQISYELFDDSPIIGTSYYRLKQTDFDGKFEYFKLIAVNFSMDEGGICTLHVYPNPCVGSCVIDLKDCPLENSQVNIELYDAFGKKIVNRITPKSKDKDISFHLNSSNNLAPGVYIVRSTANGKNESSKVIVK
jgi:hypothetical protein